MSPFYMVGNDKMVGIGSQNGNVKMFKFVNSNGLTLVGDGKNKRFCAICA